MSLVAVSLKNKGTAPGPDPGGVGIQPSDWNGDHTLSDGLAKDRYFLQCLDSLTGNLGIGNEGDVLINCPLRTCIVGPSSVIANTAAVTTFDKSITLLAGAANFQAAQVEIACAGRLLTDAVPGSGGGAIFLGAQKLIDFTTFGDFLPSAAGWLWSASVRVTVTTAGSSGIGKVGYSTVNLPALAPPIIIPPASSFSMDWTTIKLIEVKWAFSIADPQNSVVMDDLSLRVSLSGVVS